jgi:MFS family permease
VVGNIVAVAVIPLVGHLSDKIGRRPPIIVGSVLAGLMSFGYLYAISIHNVPLAVLMSLLMWGVVYQGYNAVFPSFYPEMFPTRTRVSGMAISQNLDTLVTAMLPAVFVAVAPPGAANIPLTIGSITLVVTVIAAIAAWTARETYRVHLNDLGNQDAVPVPRTDDGPMRGPATDTVQQRKAA